MEEKHIHIPIPPIDPSTIQLFHTCKCGAVKQVLDKNYKPVNDSWHVCSSCVYPSFKHILN